VVLRIDYSPLPESTLALRDDVRAFVREALADRDPRLGIQSWTRFDAEFSRKLGARGWIGMTWPRECGGAGRSALERYVVTEELLAAGAPVGAHWIADRQSGPLLLRYGTEQQRCRYVPAIARGECYFCIGMSEPDAGSDLASLRTRARRVEGGWQVTGTKVWTTLAHRCHMMILLARTSPETGDRHSGLSQFLIDLSSPGVSVRPIRDMSGEDHFNEVVLDTFVPDAMLLGREGEGWKQVTAELAFERSGPERILSTYRLLVELLRCIGPEPSREQAIAIGRLTAHLITLRQLSIGMASMLDRGLSPGTEAALVKDLGTTFEQSLPEIARLIAPAVTGFDQQSLYHSALAYSILHAPAFSLRGGTREILRGIIARGLGLR
jgi:alkylation response protein AidB-like acyl-CoA dehydrogenase